MTVRATARGVDAVACRLLAVAEAERVLGLDDLRHGRTWVRSPQTNGVIERFFGTLKYEHLSRGVNADGDALDMEVHPFRIVCNSVRPHQALGDQPSATYTGREQRKATR